MSTARASASLSKPSVASPASKGSTRDDETLADLIERLGGIPPERIRFHPFPGTATIADVVRLQEKHGILCELVEGVLVEKAMGWEESNLGTVVIEHLNGWIRPRNLGLVAGADGTVEILIDLVRIPDASYVSWDRLPGRRRPKKAVPRVVPNLVVEVLSRSNTRKEMQRKRKECFKAGVELFWEIDPKKRIVRVYTSATEFETLSETDTLSGGQVLPGFEISLAELFSELDRHG